MCTKTSYPSADTASAGGDLEVSIQVFDGSTGEEALHHQQDAIDEESRSNAVDHILDNDNPGEWAESHWKHPQQHNVTLCSQKCGIAIGWEDLIVGEGMLPSPFALVT